MEWTVNVSPPRSIVVLLLAFLIGAAFLAQELAKAPITEPHNGTAPNLEEVVVEAGMVRGSGDEKANAAFSAQHSRPLTHLVSDGRRPAIQLTPRGPKRAVGRSAP